MNEAKGMALQMPSPSADATVWSPIQKGSSVHDYDRLKLTNEIQENVGEDPFQIIVGTPSSISMLQDAVETYPRTRQPMFRVQ